MTTPRIFWLSASLAVVLVGLSAAYYLLVSLPAAQRHKDELAAEIANHQASEKQIADCAEQARRAGQDMGKYASGIGPPSTVSGVINHYNRKLSKCIADVQTVDKGGTGEIVMDAYEQSSIFLCTTRFTPALRRMCLDAENKQIDPTEADKRIEALLHE
jgi:hypothetical protein